MAIGVSGCQGFCKYGEAITLTERAVHTFADRKVPVWEDRARDVLDALTGARRSLGSPGIRSLTRVAHNVTMGCRPSDWLSFQPFVVFGSRLVSSATFATVPLPITSATPAVAA